MSENDIKVRVAGEEDAEALLAIYAPYVKETAITFEYEVPDVEEFQRRIRNTLKRYPYLVAEQEGKAVGYAYAGPFHARPAYDWAVETSIYVDRGTRGRGVGKRLYEALERALTAQGILNLNACIAYPPSEEDPYLTRDSVRFHEHMGYRMVGEFYSCGYKFKRWYNMVWMEKLIGEHLTEQLPVRNFGNFAGDKEERTGQADGCKVI